TSQPPRFPRRSWREPHRCFWYYETLRTTGVILAVIMFVSGILIALSRSAAGELAGHSPDCGCWDQLLCSAATAGSPPGGGYHGDRLPCVKLCGREPVGGKI
uniref:FXYD domain-containing ion transport regulator n=1 Tax=Haplochromis burtoni TaxID=8153 RepID=A0A3Q3BQ18_HAPBU